MEKNDQSSLCNDQSVQIYTTETIFNLAFKMADLTTTSVMEVEFNDTDYSLTTHIITSTNSRILSLLAVIIILVIIILLFTSVISVIFLSVVAKQHDHMAELPLQQQEGSLTTGCWGRHICCWDNRIGGEKRW